MSSSKLSLHMDIDRYRYTHVDVDVDVNIYIHTYIYLYIHIYKNMYTYTWVQMIDIKSTMLHTGHENHAAPYIQYKDARSTYINIQEKHAAIYIEIYKSTTQHERR